MQSVENHYSDDAIEKSNENREEHGNCMWVKFTKKTQMIAKKPNWGPRSRLKMEMKARRMIFPAHYFTLLSTKIEIALIFCLKNDV